MDTPARLRYPITDLATLLNERAFFLRAREAMAHAETFANRNTLFARIDADLAFNARLIAQAEDDARRAELAKLGHVATAGAWMS